MQSLGKYSMQEKYIVNNKIKHVLC